MAAGALLRSLGLAAPFEEGWLRDTSPVLADRFRNCPQAADDEMVEDIEIFTDGSCIFLGGDRELPSAGWGAIFFANGGGTPRLLGSLAGPVVLDKASPHHIGAERATAQTA